MRQALCGPRPQGLSDFFWLLSSLSFGLSWLSARTSPLVMTALAAAVTAVTLVVPWLRRRAQAPSPAPAR